MMPEREKIVTVLDLRKEYQKILDAWKEEGCSNKTLAEIKSESLNKNSNDTIAAILKQYPIINMDSAIALFSSSDTDCLEIAEKTYQEQKEWLKTKLNNPKSSEVAAEALPNKLEDLKDISARLGGLAKQQPDSQTNEQKKKELQEIQKLIEEKLTDADDAKAAIEQASRALDGEQKPVEALSQQEQSVIAQSQSNQLVTTQSQVVVTGIKTAKDYIEGIEGAKNAIDALLAKAEAKAKADVEKQAADNKKLISLLEENRKTKLVLKNEEKDGVKENVDAFIACIFQRTNQRLVEKLKQDVKTYERKRRFYVHTITDGPIREKKKKALGELIKELEEGKFSQISIGDKDHPGFLYCSHRQGEAGENNLEFILAYQDSDGLKDCLRKIKETMEEVPGAGRVMNFHTKDDMAEKIAWALENGIECEFNNQPCFFQQALRKINGELDKLDNPNNNNHNLVDAILNGIDGRAHWIGGKEKNQILFMKHYFRSETGEKVKQALFKQLQSLLLSQEPDGLSKGLAMKKLLTKAGEPLIGEYAEFNALHNDMQPANKEQPQQENAMQ